MKYIRSSYPGIVSYNNVVIHWKLDVFDGEFKGVALGNLHKAWSTPALVPVWIGFSDVLSGILL